MKAYKRLFQESQADDFAKQIEDTIKKIFPKSYINVKFSYHIQPSISILFTVGGKNQWSHGIYDNDIAIVSGHIWGIDKEGNVPQKVQFEASRGGNIMVKPEEGSYYAYDRIKVGLSKKTGTPEQILKHLDNYFKKLKKALKDNIDRIKPEDLKLIKGNF